MFGLSRKKQIVAVVVFVVVAASLIALRVSQQYFASCSLAWPEASEGPTLSIGEVNGTSVTLNFVDNSEGETGFDIFRDLVFIDNVTSTSGGSTGSNYTYEDTGVTYNASYTWIVKAVRGDCDPLNSDAKSAITLAARPLAPTLTEGSLSAKIVITTPDNNPTVTEYAVFNETLGRYLTASGARQGVEFWSTWANFGGATGIIDSGLVAGTTYTYKIIARNLNNVKTIFSLPASILISNSSGGGDDDPPDDDPPDGDDPPGGGDDDPPGGGSNNGGGSEKTSEETTNTPKKISEKTTSTTTAKGEEELPGKLVGYILIFLFTLKVIILLLTIDADKRLGLLDRLKK